jgi:hypothetical protein
MPFRDGLLACQPHLGCRPWRLQQEIPTCWLALHTGFCERTPRRLSKRSLQGSRNPLIIATTLSGIYINIWTPLYNTTAGDVVLQLGDAFLHAEAAYNLDQICRELSSRSSNGLTHRIFNATLLRPSVRPGYPLFHFLAAIHRRLGKPSVV